MQSNDFGTDGLELIQSISASTNSNNAMIGACIAPADTSNQASETAQALIDDLFAMS